MKDYQHFCNSNKLREKRAEILSDRLGIILVVLGAIMFLIIDGLQVGYLSF